MMTSMDGRFSYVSKFGKEERNLEREFLSICMNFLLHSSVYKDVPKATYIHFRLSANCLTNSIDYNNLYLCGTYSHSLD